MTQHLSLHGTFVADHYHDLPGFVEARHGHNWEVTATVEAEGEGDPGLAPALERWIQGIDYTLLNQQPRLEGRNPTAEVLAQWLLEELQTAGLRPVVVKVREKIHYWAACLPGDRS